MKISALITTMLLATSITSCKSRNLPEDADVKGAVSFSETSRAQAIADADAWGDYWSGAGPIEKIEALDQARIRDIQNKDLFKGPEDDFFNAANFQGNAEGGALPITCVFDEETANPNDPPGGKTAKFGCIYNGKSIKVKYDPAISVQEPTGCKVPLTANSGLYGEIVATRIMWALGFRVDKMYPAKVTCENCPIDPWGYIRKKAKVLDFKDNAIKQICPEGKFAAGKGPETRHEGPFVYFPAATEAKIAGESIVTNVKEGWSFQEIFDENASYSQFPKKKKRQKIHREALAVFMAFLSHADSKEDNQRLVCLDKKDKSAKSCDKPFLMVHDPGNVMGRGWAPFQNMKEGLKPTSTIKIDLKRWIESSPWAGGDSSKCTIHVNKHVNGTLENQTVSAEGVNFLKSLIIELSREQIVDAFRGALVHYAPANARNDVAPDAEKWGSAFFAKMKKDILSHKCMN